MGCQLFCFDEQVSNLMLSIGYEREIATASEGCLAMTAWVSYINNFDAKHGVGCSQWPGMFSSP